MADVLKATQLRAKDDDELRQMVETRELKVAKTAPRDRVIQALVESSYPVQDLPKVRPTSKRGTIISAFVAEDGKPKTAGTEVDGLVKHLVDTFGISQEDALSQVKLYMRDMVRYYGYTKVGDSNGVVKFKQRTK